MLSRDEALIKRGRDAAGNLAHALKTPISIVKTLSNRLGGAERDSINEELQRMEDSVKHHLARASAAGPLAIRQGVNVQTTLKPIFEAVFALGARRGSRLDENQPGWGLGLSIVNELVGLYQGNLDFENLDTGGLKVQVTFPIH